MFVVQTDVDIDRPVPEVFDFVADMTNAPLWQSGLDRVQRIPPGPVRVGSEHVFVRRFAGRLLRSRNRITALDPPSRIAFEIPDGWISGQAAYEVTPTGGGSRVSCRMEFRASGPGRFVEPLLARLLRQDSRRDDQRLKAMLESLLTTANVPSTQATPHPTAAQSRPARHAADPAASRWGSGHRAADLGVSVARPAGALLLAAASANLAGVVLFLLRDGVNGGLPPNQAYLIAERGLIMAGMLVSALGFCLLDDRERDSVLLRFGTLGYLAAGVIGVVAETMNLAGQAVYPATAAYVVLAFLTQAVIGLALARNGLVKPWLGWLTLVWNMAWLVGLSLSSSDDVYFPILHLVMPIPIGIALLRPAKRRAAPEIDHLA